MVHKQISIPCMRCVKCGKETKTPLDYELNGDFCRYCNSFTEWKESTEFIAPNSIREHVFGEHNGKCYYCGKPIDLELFHVDHKHPKSKGGANSVENYVAACSKCNIEKSNRYSAEEFRKLKQK